MRHDEIREVGINGEGSLYVVPAVATFPYIYREAMQVGWDPTESRLFSPKPREWTHLQWFQQIVSAAKEQGCLLEIGKRTKWVNIPVELQTEISQWSISD